MKLQLPTVTLLTADCVDTNRAIKVLEHCKSLCDFGAVKLLTSIPNNYEHSVKILPLNSLIMYSIFMLTKVHEFIETEKVLIVQRDGWILNPGSFNPDWLELDYIGPLFVQYDKVGSGGFSLRSKKIMQEVSNKIQHSEQWNWSREHANLIQESLHYYEDGVISLSEFGKRFKIASNEQAANFGQGGNKNSTYFRLRPFGFHRTWQDIDFNTGIVHSSVTSKDLHSSYDQIIDLML